MAAQGSNNRRFPTRERTKVDQHFANVPCRLGLGASHTALPKRTTRNAKGVVF